MSPIFAGDLVSHPTRVLVEPISEDDWELLVSTPLCLAYSQCPNCMISRRSLQERYPTDVEEQLLNQIKIVYQHQVFPYWIAGQHLIRLRVGEVSCTVARNPDVCPWCSVPHGGGLCLCLAVEWLRGGRCSKEAHQPEAHQ